MLNLLRLSALLLGCVLMVTPLLLGLQFAYGIGEPPRGIGDFIYYSILLLAGVPLGLGPFMISLPNTVAGRRTPVARAVAGLLLAATVAALLFIGFDGTVTRLASPAIMLFEVCLFALFVWPARPFLRTP